MRLHISPIWFYHNCDVMSHSYDFSTITILFFATAILYLIIASTFIIYCIWSHNCGCIYLTMPLYTLFFVIASLYVIIVSSYLKMPLFRTIVITVISQIVTSYLTLQSYLTIATLFFHNHNFISHNCKITFYQLQLCNLTNVI